MNAGASDSPLLFNWQPPRPRKLSIVMFICASVILHAFCFYLFQIVYAPAVVLLPPPARVSLITSNSEEGRTMLRWIDAEDPALASATLRPPDAQHRPLPKVQHVPSYVAEGPKLKSAPPFVSDTRVPSLYPPGPVPSPRPEPPAQFGKVETQISFSEELSEWGPAQFAAAHFTASSTETPQAVRFRIAVGPTGAVRHCFPLNSSGDAALDQQARQHLITARFKPKAATTVDPSAETWGIATVDWGNDVTPPPGAPHNQPTP
jgi:TonB family protein